MSRIFINYRRDDSAPYAGRLFDHLSAHFGPDKIFMDIDTIKPGVDFVEVIEKAVATTNALLVVIGKQWLTIADENGKRRLDDPRDFVRLEIATALNRNVRVIPVLVDKAKMPQAEELPDALVRLARRNALEISNERFSYDVGKLISTLEDVLHANPEPQVGPAQYRPPVSNAEAIARQWDKPSFQQQPRRWRPPATLLLIIAAIIAAIGVSRLNQPPTANSPLASFTAKVPTMPSATVIPTSSYAPPQTLIPGTCKSGFVWREAYPGDEVCVTPDGRAQAAADNAAAASRRVAPGTCVSGYVWRDAFAGDKVCVVPARRDQAAADNAADRLRKDPAGPYGPDTCISGYVWREANPSDHVCVTPDVRAPVAADNAAASSRVVPADTCISGYVWREANPGDHVCVTPAVRSQTVFDNSQAPSRWATAP